jgi:hypothetical protein
LSGKDRSLFVFSDFSACKLPGKNINSSQAIPLRRQVRKQKALITIDIAINAGPFLKQK